MPDTKEKETPIEQMIVSAARLITDGSVLMVGTQWPIIVSLLAKSLHAPGVTICYEGGVILAKVPDRIPLFTADPVINSSSALLGNSFDTLGMILHGGRADMALLSAASVDRYGNINTTDPPRSVSVGAGGHVISGAWHPRPSLSLNMTGGGFPSRWISLPPPGT